MKKFKFIKLFLLFVALGCVDSNRHVLDNNLLIIKFSDSKYQQQVEMIINLHNNRAFITNNEVGNFIKPPNPNINKNQLFEKRIINETLIISDKDIERITSDLSLIDNRDYSINTIDGVSVAMILYRDNKYMKYYIGSNNKKLISDVVQIIMPVTKNKWYFNRFLL